MGYCEDIDKRYTNFKLADSLFDCYNIIILNYYNSNSMWLGLKVNEIQFDHAPGGVTCTIEGKDTFIDTDLLVKIFESCYQPQTFYYEYDSTINLKFKLLREACNYTALYEKAAMIRVKELRPEFKEELVYELEVAFNKYDICVMFALDSFDEEYCITAEELDIIAEDNKPIAVEDILI